MATGNPSRLVVSFFRNGEPTAEWHTADGAHAAAAAIMAISARLVLYPGDTITCRLASDEHLPEISRASHYS
jgi:hypothetical protein